MTNILIVSHILKSFSPNFPSNNKTMNENFLNSLEEISYFYHMIYNWQKKVKFDLILTTLIKCYKYILQN